MPSVTCKNILVVRTDRIGDVVLTTPVFKALRAAYPAARITVLLSSSTVDLVRGNPYIDDVMVDDRKGVHKGTLGFLGLARDIRRRSFDTVFLFHNKKRYNLTSFLAGVPCRIGYNKGQCGMLLTHPLTDTRHLGQKHEAEYCLDLLRSVGIKDAGLDIHVAFNKNAESWASEWLKANAIAPGEFIAIHPGASDTTRLWPVESYSHLIDGLAGLYPFKIVLIGGAETKGIAAQIVSLSRVPVIDLTGQSSLAETASILRRCRILVSNDSGPLHVGAGVGAYVIALFLRNQSGINPTRWRPLGPRAFMLVNKPGEEITLDKKGRVQGGKADSITVEEVLDAVGHILRQDHQSLFYW